MGHIAENLLGGGADLPEALGAVGGAIDGEAKAKSKSKSKAKAKAKAVARWCDPSDDAPKPAPEDTPEEALANASPVSKQQKYVFDRTLAFLPQELQDTWNALVLDKSPGVQSRRNNFISGLIPKDVAYRCKIDVSSLPDYTHLLEETEEAKRKDASVGKTQTGMIAMLGGSKTLFDDGIARGDIVPADGMYLMREVSISREKIEKKSELLRVVQALKTGDDLKSRIHELSADSAGWIEFVENPAIWIKDGESGSASSSVMAGAEVKLVEVAMERLQEAFDTTTRLTLAVKSVSIELVKAVGMNDGAAAAMRDRGIALCKDLIAPTELMEGLLVQAIHQINISEVKDALRVGAQKCMQLERFYHELEALLKHHTGKRPKPL